MLKIYLTPEMQKLRAFEYYFTRTKRNTNKGIIESEE
jgi:hypothetical protein